MKTKLERAERKESLQKKKLFLPLFLASIMIFSAFAVVLSSFGGPEDESGTIKYKEYTFRPQGNSWGTTVGGRPLLLRYNPHEVAELHSEIDLTQLQTLFSSKKIYLTVTPGERVETPLRELYTNLKPILPQIFLACTTSEGCDDLPVRTFEDAKEDAVVFLLVEGNELSLETKEYCSTLTGNERDLTTFSDKFLLHIYGL